MQVQAQAPIETQELAAVLPIEVTDTGQVLPMPGQRRRGLTAPAWVRAVLRNRKAAVGVMILILFAVVALLAPVLAPGDPRDFVARPHLQPSAEHIFGTTGQGQDVFSQTVWGGRATLSIGILVGLLTTVVGIVVGLSAGYFGGITDDVLSLVTNVFLIIPSLPLLVVLAAFLGSGNALYFVLVLTVTGWAWPARVMRAQTLSLRTKDFVAAAKVGGESGPRIILAEILPNMLSIVVASFLGSTIFAIGALAALEFLGLGNPSAVTWGTNLYWASNNAGLLTGAWWTFVPAGACIALVAFAFALVNYAIDELTNPRLRAQRERTGILKRLPFGRASSRSTPVVNHAG
ncbi:MAG: binding-protein-dependent transport system inner rane component [Thermomicrobiales bacterium]|jgi:peptide/nickel transport system permease protein|nr:binding-protein-dependent transport system inner rane component [Thermomicrobiales bacterium]